MTDLAWDGLIGDWEWEGISVGERLVWGRLAPALRIVAEAAGGAAVVDVTRPWTLKLKVFLKNMFLYFRGYGVWLAEECKE